MADLEYKKQQSKSLWAGIFVGPGLFLLAGWFLWGPDIESIPEIRSAKVNPAFLTTAPRRKPLGDPPVIHINGFDRTCMDCHKLFPPRENPPAKLLTHSHILLVHGINDQCRSCHDVHNRNRLVLQNGDSIPYAKVTRLCADCHGPTFRDWERGMHGRTIGYWDATKGEPLRLGCSECHDPHRPRGPAMEPMAPLPPPHTLRMAPLKMPEGGEAKERDPLRQVLIRAVEERTKSHKEEEF